MDGTLADLKDGEKAILALLQNKPKSTKEELTGVSGRSLRTVQGLLNSLVEKKHITRIGGKRFGYLKILK